jgi:hypothetical protein
MRATSMVEKRLGRGEGLKCGGFDEQQKNDEN